MVEVGETEEGLDVLDSAWFQPILDNLDFVHGHCKTVGREHIPEVSTGSDVKFTFVCTGKKAISTKAS